MHKKELFVCNCGDVAHQFIVSEFDWDGIDEICVDVRLNRNLPWYKRIPVAIRYVFGMKPSRFGDYDEILLDPKDADRLQEIVDDLRRIGGNV